MGSYSYSYSFGGGGGVALEHGSIGLLSEVVASQS